MSDVVALSSSASSEANLTRFAFRFSARTARQFCCSAFGTVLSGATASLGDDWPCLRRVFLASPLAFGVRLESAASWLAARFGFVLAGRGYDLSYASRIADAPSRWDRGSHVAR